MQLRPKNPAWYIVTIAIGLVVGLVASQRSAGVFSCQPQAGASRYIAYCAGAHYGDYDHGAFWFNLEPAALAKASSAQTIFLGNSRMEVAFSTHATEQWFAARSRTYYLLGFMYNEPVGFASALLGRMKPRANSYVINLDYFFRDELSEPADFVVDDPSARARYVNKRRLQHVQGAICGRASIACGNREVWYRRIDNGALEIRDGGLSPTGIDISPPADEAEVMRHVARGRSFLAGLGVVPNCVVFTLSPYSTTPLDLARKVAGALGANLVFPSSVGLRTRDGSHLDEASAEIWSARFFEQAGAVLSACNGESQVAL